MFKITLLSHRINIRILSKPICHSLFEPTNDRTNRTRGLRKRWLRLCRGEKFFAPFTTDNTENTEGSGYLIPFLYVYRLIFLCLRLIFLIKEKIDDISLFVLIFLLILYLSLGIYRGNSRIAPTFFLL